MRSVTTTLALALSLVGCGPVVVPSNRVELLTGVEGCYAGGQQPTYAGVLVPDPEYGTRIDAKPVMWPVGFTGSRLASGGIAVLDRSGEVIATTGREYAISPVRVWGETEELLQRIGAIPVPDLCYPWDFVDCTASAEDPGIAERGCPPTPTYDLAAVKANFEHECQDPSALEETCQQIDVDGMRGDGPYLTVPLTFPERDRERAQVVCEQIASAQDDLAGEPLGYGIVVIEGSDNQRLAECTTDG